MPNSPGNSELISLSSDSIVSIVSFLGCRRQSEHALGRRKLMIVKILRGHQMKAKAFEQANGTLILDLHARQVSVNVVGGGKVLEHRLHRALRVAMAPIFTGQNVCDIG